LQSIHPYYWLILNKTDNKSICDLFDFILFYINVFSLAIPRHMQENIQCTYCRNAIPINQERCPHCAQPGLFPNVNAAVLPAEQEALEKRYAVALSEASKKGVLDKVNRFESAMAESRAVIARSANELLRLVTSDNEMYTTHYRLIESEIRLPKGDKWDILRAVVDSALFPNQMKNIRFAALSLDGTGLSHYGECSMTLRSAMIEHRASVFEENSIVFMNAMKSALQMLINYHMGIVPPLRKELSCVLRNYRGRLRTLLMIVNSRSCYYMRDQTRRTMTLLKFTYGDQ